MSTRALDGSLLAATRRFRRPRSPRRIADGDIGRLEKVRHERDALSSELERAFGLGGRARASGSASERARVNVQRRLKDAIGRIAEHDSAMGRFFDKAVSTGTYCRFFV